MIALFLVAFSIVADGAQDFTLHNRSQHDIDALYISEVNDDQWGSDILGAYARLVDELQSCISVRVRS